jgi:hypothetical protein
MKRPLAALVAVLLCALALSGGGGPAPAEGALAPEAELDSLRVRPRLQQIAPTLGSSAEGGTLPESSLATKSPVVPIDAGVSRADRLAAEEAATAEARANRQRLLFRNLTDLESAAERAEQEGKPEYAAALRRRAEVLKQSAKVD